VYNGFINLLKPPGMTSNDAVSFIRRRLKGDSGVKVGHAGTLDPEAVGVLPIMLGKATRMSDELMDKRKEYIAKWTPGASTDTQDAQGRIVARSDRVPSDEELDAILRRFVGDIRQTPPAYSAIKIGGVPSYRRARMGEAAVLEERSVRVFALEWLGGSSWDGRMLRAECGRGVYVRTLCEDIGRVAGCASHMSFLLRTRCGPFGIEDSVTLEECVGLLERGGGEVFARQIIQPLDVPLYDLPMHTISPAFAARARCGNPVPLRMLEPEPVPGRVRLYLDGELVGIGIASKDGVSFRPMLL